MAWKAPKKIRTTSCNLFCVLSDRLLSAGHDISDGGLLTCLLEMAFAGNSGIDVELTSQGAGG